MLNLLKSFPLLEIETGLGQKFVKKRTLRPNMNDATGSPCRFPVSHELLNTSTGIAQGRQVLWIIRAF